MQVDVRVHEPTRFDWGPHDREGPSGVRPEILNTTPMPPSDTEWPSSGFTMIVGTPMRSSLPNSPAPDWPRGSYSSISDLCGFETTSTQSIDRGSSKRRSLGAAKGRVTPNPRTIADAKNIADAGNRTIARG